jgi:hypothetical protein
MEVEHKSPKTKAVGSNKESVTKKKGTPEIQGSGRTKVYTRARARLLANKDDKDV